MTNLYSLSASLFYLFPFATFAISDIYVDSATIIAEQGNEIYANGLMQAKLRINYKLREGVSFKSLTLLEYETGETLSTLGWEVSGTDNGYDHSLGNQRTNQTPYDNQSISIYKYLSTKKSNTYINICIQLVTTKDSQDQTYSTCYDPGIYQGFTSLYAHRPPKYYDSDFAFSTKRYMFKEYSGTFEEKEKIDIAGQVFSLYATSTIPRNIRFRLQDSAKDKILTDNNFKTDQRKEIAYKYEYGTPPSTEAGKADETLYIGYKSMYFYDMLNSAGQPTESIYFHYYDIAQSIERKKQVKAFTDSEIVNILEVSFYKNSFMWTDTSTSPPSLKNTSYRCWIKDTNNYSCASILESPLYTTDVSKSLIGKTSRPFAEIPLVDNFGNQHTIFWIAFES